MCDNKVEWRVIRGNAYTYVCTEHLIDAIMKYGGDSAVAKVVGWSDCYWKDDSIVEVTQQKLTDIAAEVIATVLRKNADYGDAWQRQGIPGLVSRVSDKMYRVDTLADGREAMVENENLRDTLIDAIGYCMLGLLYLEARGCQNTPAKSAD